MISSSMKFLSSLDHFNDIAVFIKNVNIYKAHARYVLTELQSQE